jgi:hypothetical protein
MILYEAGKDHQAAMATAFRLLSRDALREDAYRVIMRAYCHLGQRKAALEQYERFRKTLLNELGAEPLGETQELYQAILKRRFVVGPPDFRSVTALAVEHTGRDPLDVTSTVRLIGREQEIAFLEDCWRAALKKHQTGAHQRKVGIGKRAWWRRSPTGFAGRASAFCGDAATSSSTPCLTSLSLMRCEHPSLHWIMINWQVFLPGHFVRPPGLYLICWKCTQTIAEKARRTPSLD